MLPTNQKVQLTPNSIVSWIKDVSSELFIIRVKTDTGDIPQFKAGQYAELAVIPDEPANNFKLVRRAYSIASSELEKHFLEFYIAYIKDGFLSPKLQKLEIGDRIWLGPKIKGKFTLDNLLPDKEVITVCSGTGIAPFISFYKTHKNNPPWRSFVLIHGVRYSQDLGYRQELEEFARTDNTFKYLPICSRENSESNWTGACGRVQNILFSDSLTSNSGITLNPKTCSVYLCGNPAMIEETRVGLEKRGFVVHTQRTPGNIYFERYW